MSHRGEAVKLVKHLRRTGFSVEIVGTGHWEVRTNDGERVTTFPSTPSDSRWKQNTEGNIKRWERGKGIPAGSSPLHNPVPLDTHGVESSGRAASLEVHPRWLQYQ